MIPKYQINLVWKYSALYGSSSSLPTEGTAHVGPLSVEVGRPS